ncbi:DUF295 domain-containing protein [Citrus sinensis]|uniref:DUF295 domain-containing protein n=1 Tax=Citrus sinensis TaxID=2711 RepID=A0ACB8JP48_CITSI|nr:DUF295 domain-containing protein [Citrus sinensis]
MLRLKTDSITFFSVSNGFSRHVDLPKASNRSSWCFSSKGWLIEIESVKLTISLLHPFSLRQLELPSINSFPYSSNDWTNDINDTDVGIFLIIRCVLSSSFCPNSDSSQDIAYARPGDKVWTRVRNSNYFDVIYYRDQFYAINGLGQIFAIKGDFPVQIAKPPTEFIQVGDHVECLLSPYTCTTMGFNVFQVDLNNNKWIKMASLGCRSFFLGLNSSLLINASNNSYCKPNCIYVTDDYVHVYWYNIDERTHIGICNMEDGRIEPLYQGNLDHCFVPLMWIEHSS